MPPESLPNVNTETTPRQRIRNRKPVGIKQVIKIAMLVVTGLWLLAIPACGTLGFMASYDRHGLIDAGGGQYIDVERNYLMSEGELIGESVATAFSAGVVLPTIPFVIAMVALGVAWLATKK